MKYFIFIILAALLFACENQKPTPTGLEGQTLPTFKLLLVDSSTWINTSTIPKGKPIVLFYFSPICPYCMAETRQIIDDMDKLKDVQFYMVTSSPFKAMKSYYTKYHLNKYPNITVGRDSSNFILNYFNTSLVPFTAIYGKDKKLQEAFSGLIYGNQIRKAVMD